MSPDIEVMNSRHLILTVTPLLFRRLPLKPRTAIKMASANLSTQTSTSEASFASVGVRNTQIEQATGVQLSDHQKVLVGSVLDVSLSIPCSAASTDCQHSFSLGTRPSSTSASGPRTQPFRIHFRYPQDTPSTRPSGMAFQRCSIPSPSSRTR